MFFRKEDRRNAPITSTTTHSIQKTPQHGQATRRVSAAKTLSSEEHPHATDKTRVTTRRVHTLVVDPHRRSTILLRSGLGASSSHQIADASNQTSEPTDSLFSHFHTRPRQLLR